MLIAAVALAMVTGALIQPGDLGDIDATRRLQVAHSWWTDEPAVAREDEPFFGVPNANGEFQAWYGAGQSIAMLLPDILATAVARQLAESPQRQLQIRKASVSLMLGPTLAALILLLAYQIARHWRLPWRLALLSAVVMLCGTSTLVYLQILQENSLDLVLVLAFWLLMSRFPVGLCGGLLACTCGAWLVLVRLPNLAVVGLMTAALVCLYRDHWRRAVLVAAIGLSAGSVGLVLDRAYHLARFGEWTSTYLGLYAAYLVDHGRAPPTFPFGTYWLDGLWGSLFSPAKSVFLFDPLLVVVIVCTFLVLRRSQGLKDLRILAWCAASALVLSFQLLFFCTYSSWYGGASWGNRLTLLGVQMWCFALVPLLHSLHFRGWRVVLVGAFAVACAVQLLGISLWFVLEIQQYQSDATGGSLWRRAMNVMHILTGEVQSTGGLSPRLLRWNFLAFHVAAEIDGKVGSILRWLWSIAACGLLALWSLLIWLLLRGPKPITVQLPTSHP